MMEMEWVFEKLVYLEHLTRLSVRENYTDTSVAIYCLQKLFNKLFTSDVGPYFHQNYDKIVFKAKIHSEKDEANNFNLYSIPRVVVIQQLN